MRKPVLFVGCLLVACGPSSEPLPTLYVIPTLPASATVSPPGPSTLPATWTASPQAEASFTPVSSSTPTRDPTVCWPEDLAALQDPVYSISVDVTVSALAVDGMGECHRESLGGATSLLVLPADIQESINLIQGSITKTGEASVLPCAESYRQAAMAYHLAALEVVETRRACDPVDEGMNQLNQASDTYTAIRRDLEDRVSGLETVFSE